MDHIIWISALVKFNVFSYTKLSNLILCLEEIKNWNK